MKDLTLKRKFLKISDKFRTGKFDLSDIALIINELRFSIGGLTSDEVNLLLEVPISVYVT